jgi:hypothetical protein
LFQPPDQLQAPPKAAYARSVAKPSDRAWQSKTIELNFENVGESAIFYFPPSKRGGWGLVTLALHRGAECHRIAFLFKSLQSVQTLIACGTPQPAWLAAPFALNSNLHKKRTQSPSAGGG